MSVKQISQFFRGELWTMDENKLHPFKRMGLTTLRRIVITYKCFIDNNLSSYSSALTYSCILAFVPVLSIIYALARGLGWGDEIEQRLRSNLNASQSTEIADNLFDFVHRYIENTHNGVFLGAGLIILIFTVINLSSSIEIAFNSIWHARSSRNVYRRIMDYTAILVLFPLLIVVTSGFSVFLMSMTGQFSDYDVISGTMRFILRYMPLLFASLCFIALFKFMPNTTVRWKSVLFPGFMTGVLFQMLQSIYFQYQLKLTSYNAVYGSFAALPLFIFWLQLSWYLCLVGGQLSYVIQHGADYMFMRENSNLMRRDHDALCLYLMAKVCRRFASGETPYTYEELSAETQLPLRMIRGLMDEMLASNLLSEVYSQKGKESAYQPALDINLITPNYVIQQLDHHGKKGISNSWTTNNSEWRQMFDIRNLVQLTHGQTPLYQLTSICHETELSENKDS